MIFYNLNHWTAFLTALCSSTLAVAATSVYGLLVLVWPVIMGTIQAQPEATCNCNCNCSGA